MSDSFNPSVADARAAHPGVPTELGVYGEGPEWISVSIDKICTRARQGRNDWRIKARAVKELTACGLDGRSAPSIREKATCLLNAIRKDTIWVPDPVGTEMIQSAAATWCVDPTLCIKGGDCDDLVALTMSAMMSIGIVTELVKQKLRFNKQEHVLCVVLDEHGEWLYVDPSFQTPVGECQPFVDEVRYDPMTHGVAEAGGNPEGAEIVGVGAGGAGHVGWDDWPAGGGGHAGDWTGAAPRGDWRGGGGGGRSGSAPGPSMRSSGGAISPPPTHAPPGRGRGIQQLHAPPPGPPSPAHALRAGLERGGHGGGGGGGHHGGGGGHVHGGGGGGHGHVSQRRFFHGQWWDQGPTGWIVVEGASCGSWGQPIVVSANLLARAAEVLVTSGGAPATDWYGGVLYLYTREGAHGGIVVRPCLGYGAAGLASGPTRRQAVQAGVGASIPAGNWVVQPDMTIVQGLRYVVIFSAGARFDPLHIPASRAWGAADAQEYFAPTFFIESLTQDKQGSLTDYTTTWILQGIARQSGQLSPVGPQPNAPFAAHVSVALVYREAGGGVATPPAPAPGSPPVSESGGDQGISLGTAIGVGALGAGVLAAGYGIWRYVEKRKKRAA